MSVFRTPDGSLTAIIRESWYSPERLREYVAQPGLPGYTLHAIAVWSVQVEQQHRRQGHCKRFLEALQADDRYDMVVVEAVQNPILADALLRWNWDCDPQVMNFYWRRP